MHLLNKEEAFSSHILALHFLPSSSSSLLPTGLMLILFTGTYFAEPLSPDKIISTSQIATNA